ncbi:MAG: hypothetical protein JRM73_01625 [Nitrososphaerota archaeon]|nr:hypothetical protein [Nitrososphaerota archaeon]
MKGDIRAPEVKTVPNVISWFDISDPEGKAMRWLQVLTTDKKVVGDRA